MMDVWVRGGQMFEGFMLDAVCADGSKGYRVIARGAVEGNVIVPPLDFSKPQFGTSHLEVANDYD